MSAYSEDELRDLLDAAQQLDDLTAHPGWQRLEAHIHAKIDATLRELEGGVADWNAYVNRVGWIAGARHLVGIPAEIAAKAARARQT